MIVATILLSATMAPLTTADDQRIAEAVRLYDAGQYAEALDILEALNHEGGLSGAMLYRLAFARGRVGDAVGKQQAEALALSALETEFETAPTLENGFYLSNAYRNGGRTEDSGRTARLTTDHVEAGEIPSPAAATALFQLAKLYADQGRSELALTWYRKAITAMNEDPERHVAYLRWAHRYCAGVLASGDDPTAAREHLDALGSIGDPTPEDLDRLATVQARMGEYQEAAETWRRAERLNPSNADRPRYCNRLARLAATLESMPTAAPDGKPFKEMSQEELEAAMAREAQVALDAAAEAGGGEISAERRKELQARMDAAKPQFAAAAMEYALRGLPIRETAFFGGYAPLIFHTNRWTMPD